MATSSVAFLPQVSAQEQWGRPIKVLLGNSREQATCSLGRASFRIQTRSGKPRDYILVPTVSVWRRGCSVATNATYPREPTMLTLSNEADAAALQEQLLSMASDVLFSLLSRAPPSAPPLSLRPIKHTAPGIPTEPGPFCLGAFVVSSTVHGVFALHWAELCGPDPNGVVGFHFYCSHESNAGFSDYVPILGVDTMQVQGNVIKVAGDNRGISSSDADDYVVFRSAEEAQLWADVATAALDLHGRQRRERPLADAARRAERVVLGILRRDAARVPLLVEGAPLPARSNGAVADAVATHCRRRETARMRELAQALMGMDDADDSVAGGPSGTTVYNASGTTQYHLGTTNYNASGTTQYNFGTTQYHPGTTQYNYSGSGRYRS